MTSPPDLSNQTDSPGATGHEAAAGSRFLKAGEILPEGWIREQMRLDLKEGYLPHYGAINPTVTHELFVRQERNSGRDYDSMKSWWSGEHEGYWKDAILRMAFLCDDAPLKAQAIEWLDAIVAAQGGDGYIGIYEPGDAPDTRFRHTDENGELWTQSRIFQALAAGYEFTGKQSYLDALIRAVDCTMANDPGNYFASESKEGGASHGIGFFDTLYYLHTETGERKYADYIVRLYRNFNDVKVRDDDLKTEKLLREEGFSCHGAHVAEGLFVPALVASLTGDPEDRSAAKRVLGKLRRHLTPGGAMVCDEDVEEQPGSGAAAYEYCGIAEGVQSLTKLKAIQGDSEAMEMVETMTLNAGQGARFPVLTATAYLAHDNQFEALSEKNEQRFAYGAFHTAAACCSLNAGRLMPYYVGAMWMREPNGLTAELYGPCRVRTVIDGTAVTLREETNYPFEDSIRFHVDADRPVDFSLRLRIPVEAAGVELAGLEASERKGGYLVIRREWKNGDSFALDFDFPIRTLRETAESGEYYLKRGALVFSLPLEHRKKISPPPTEFRGNGIHPESGFHLYEITASEPTGWDYRMPPEPAFTLVSGSGDPLHPYANSPTHLHGHLLDASGNRVEVRLAPLGSTILRRTTFPASTAN
jgi:hypothetical protein